MLINYFRYTRSLFEGKLLVYKYKGVINLRKVLNIVLLIILAFTVVSCGTSGLLRNSLSEGAGISEGLIIKQSEILSNNIPVGATIDYSKAKISIDGKDTKYKFDVLIPNLISGTRKISIELEAIYPNGKLILEAKKDISIGIKELKELGNVELGIKEGYGKLQVTPLTTNDISFASSITAPNLSDLDIDKATLFFGTDRKEFNTGVQYKSGTPEITITIAIPTKDGTKQYYGTKKINPTIENISIATFSFSASNKLEFNEVKTSKNKYKVSLSEAIWKTMNRGDANAIEFKDITKITLAGTISSWTTNDTKYTLEKIKDEWVGYWDIPSGTFKFIVNEKWTGGADLNVGEIPGKMTKFYNEDVPVAFK